MNIYTNKTPTAQILTHNTYTPIRQLTTHTCTEYITNTHAYPDDNSHTSINPSVHIHSASTTSIHSTHTNSITGM